MPQQHIVQSGIFHIITKTDRRQWCVLPGVPEILIETLKQSRSIHGANLYAFAVLPNHMHIIVCPGPKGLSAFVQTWKSNSTKNVRAMLLRQYSQEPQRRDVAAADEKGARECALQECTGWQKSFFDERIRDGRQYSAAIGYVHGNAVKHGLCREVLDWPWCSLHFSHLVDAMDVWTWMT